MLPMLLLVISSLYGMYLVFLWLEVQEFKSREPIVQASDKIKLLICFRNEEERIGPLLQSISSLKGGREFDEIVFVNDHSTDRTIAKIEEELSGMNLTILDLPKDVQGKKAGLMHAFNTYPNSRFLLTDADCTFTSDCLLTADFVDSDLCAGLVRMDGSHSFLSLLQKVDWYAQSFVWMAHLIKGQAFLMSSANVLLNLKNLDLDKLDLKSKYPSGDDIHLLRNFAKQDRRIDAQLNAYTSTSVESNWKDFWNQRRRWAGKMHIYKDWPTLKLFALIGLAQLAWILSIALFLSNEMGAGLFFSIFMVRLIPDVMAVRLISSMVEDRIRIGHILLIWMIYPFYLVLLQVSSIGSRPNWRGRVYS